MHESFDVLQISYTTCVQS